MGQNVKLDKEEFVSKRILTRDIDFGSWQGPQETALV